MDPVALAVLVFVAVVALVMLKNLIGSLLYAVAIVVALLNDLVDVGVVTVLPRTWWNMGWTADLLTFFLILLAYRNAGALIALADMVPGLGFLPFNSLSLLASWAIRERGKKAYVARK